MNGTHETAFGKEVMAWREQRLQKLTADDGWLTLVGLAWLEAGENTIGGQEDNDIVVEGLPDRLGVIDLTQDDNVHIRLNPEVDAKVDGHKQEHAYMHDDNHPQPTLVNSGDVSFYLVWRGDRAGLRIKNAHASTREKFSGLDYFEIDENWRIKADWQPAAANEKVSVNTVIDVTEDHAIAGYARFTHDGYDCQLMLFAPDDADKSYFLVFADQTSGIETYSRARFLNVPKAEDGQVILDFNKAFNPPCSFTPFATCPVAPEANILPIRVTAGEKTYRLQPHL